MPTLWIDGQRVEAAPDATLLEAARQIGVSIPTLCHLPESPERQAGCLVCVVEDLDTGRLIPSCVARVTEAVRIATDSPRVREARRQHLELLLDDHRADCEAPCHLACPARLDIPKLMREVARGDFAAAALTVYQSLALPHLLAAVCPAPCEKRCHRRDLDAPLAIRALAGLAAARGMQAPVPLPSTGKRVAIIGAGPAGLAAAFFLRMQGHACHMIEAQPQAGGALVDQPIFVPTACERDLAVLLQIGVTVAFNTRLDSASALTVLSQTHDAIILCCGEAGAAPLAEDCGLPLLHGHLAPLTLHPIGKRNVPVFAVGAAVHRVRLAVMANAQGALLAPKVNALLKELSPSDEAQRPPFRAHAGTLPPAALASMVHPDCQVADRQELPDDAPPETLRREALRCLRCDCLKAENCHLRTVCSQVELPDSHARLAERAVERIRTAHGVVIELAKCIACGICVRRSQARQAPIGIAYHGRGYDVRVGPPIGYTWQDLPRDLLIDAAECCPTGAIAIDTE